MSDFDHLAMADRLLRKYGLPIAIQKTEFYIKEEGSELPVEFWQAVLDRLQQIDRR